MLATLGVILVLLGVVDLFVHLFATVGAIPLIIIGVILFIVGHSGWSPWNRGAGPGPY